MPAYEADLAAIHDEGFSECARCAAAVLRKRLAMQGFASGLVVDLGCGSGVLAGIMTAAGYDVLGIDISPAMLRLARKREPRAKFKVASILDAKVPPCVAVAAIGECVNYCFDPRAGLQALEALFERVHAALAPGGVFLLDFAEPGQLSTPDPVQRFHSRGDWAAFVEARENASRALLTRRIVTFRKAGRLYRRADEIHRLRLYPRDAVEARLKAAGFTVRALPSYGTFQLPPAHAILLARKPVRR
jgi:SAM-dependent methyltransferase